MNSDIVTLPEILKDYIINIASFVARRDFTSAALYGAEINIDEYNFYFNSLRDGSLLKEHLKNQFLTTWPVNGKSVFSIRVSQNYKLDDIIPLNQFAALQVYKLWVYLIDHYQRPSMYLSGDIFYSGGMLGRFFDGFPTTEPNGDIDIYIKPGEKRNLFLRDIAQGRFDGVIRDLPPNDAARWKRYFTLPREGKKISTVAIHLNCQDVISNYYMQLVYCHDDADPAKTTSGFDMLHCQPYFDVKTGKLYMSKNQFQAILDRKIVLNPNHIEIVNHTEAMAEYSHTDYRVKRLEERGWTLENVS